MVEVANLRRRFLVEVADVPLTFANWRVLPRFVVTVTVAMTKIFKNWVNDVDSNRYRMLEKEYCSMHL
jgi:hypothetical protein